MAKYIYNKMKQIIRKILSEMDFSFTDEIDDSPEEYQPKVGDKIVWMKNGEVVDHVYTITNIIGDEVILQWDTGSVIHHSDILYETLVKLHKGIDDVWIELVN